MYPIFAGLARKSLSKNEAVFIVPQKMGRVRELLKRDSNRFNERLLPK